MPLKVRSNLFTHFSSYSPICNIKNFHPLDVFLIVVLQSKLPRLATDLRRQSASHQIPLDALVSADVLLGANNKKQGHAIKQCPKQCDQEFSFFFTDVSNNNWAHSSTTQAHSSFTLPRAFPRARPVAITGADVRGQLTGCSHLSLAPFLDRSLSCSHGIRSGSHFESLLHGSGLPAIMLPQSRRVRAPRSSLHLCAVRRWCILSLISTLRTL